MKNIIKIILIINIFISKKINADNFFCQKICNNYNHFKKEEEIKIKNVKVKANFYDDIDLCINQCLKNISKKFIDQEPKIKEEIKFVCTNGINPETISNKEYLKLFAEGPCNPSILIPGIFGSRIEISINDCEKFQQNYSDIHETCEIKCSSLTNNMVIYNLWMTDINSPLSIFSYRRKYSQCFSKFFEVLYEYDEKSKNYKMIQKEGMLIRVKGTNDKNAKDSNCGVDATQNYAPINFITKQAYGFKKITETHIQMGYKIGVTVQHLPYDFRLSYKDTDLNILFKENIERINKITKKKIVLISHSMGNLNVIHLLKENKNLNTKIANFISLNAPFFGSTKTLFSFAGFLDDIYFHGFGIKKPDFLNGLNSLKSVYEMIPPNPQYYINQPWFQWVKNRIDHESYNDDYTYNLPGSNLLPKVTDTCYSNFKLTNNKCKYNLASFFQPFIFLKDNSNYSLRNVKEFIKKYDKNKNIEFLYNLTKYNEIAEFNPQVQTTFVFINSIETLNTVRFNRDIENEINQDEYINIDEKEFTTGDGTVPTVSVMLKAFKQAYEYENNKKIYKPVKILELCSKYNRKQENESFYDEFKDNINSYNKNSYNGIPCDCENNKNNEDCVHSKIVMDIKLNETISKLLLLKEKIDSKSFEKHLEEISEEEIEEMHTECPQLRYIGFGFNKNIPI